MNKKEKIFIVNNQEDEDGYNLNPENSSITENVKCVAERQARNNTVNNPSGVIKEKPGGLFVSARVPEKK